MDVQPCTRCYCMGETYQGPRVPQTFIPHIHRDFVIAKCAAGPGISRAWLSPGFHVQGCHRKCCCDPSKGMVAMSIISNSNPAWNPLLLSHPSVAFPVDPTHQVKPLQLLSSTCRLLLPNIWKVRAALSKLGGLPGKVGCEFERCVCTGTVRMIEDWDWGLAESDAGGDKNGNLGLYWFRLLRILVLFHKVYFALFPNMQEI